MEREGFEYRGGVRLPSGALPAGGGADQAPRKPSLSEAAGHAGAQQRRKSMALEASSILRSNSLASSRGDANGLPPGLTMPVHRSGSNESSLSGL